MFLKRQASRGLPSRETWNEWSNLVNNDLQNFSPQDDYASINDKLHDLLIRSGMKNIGAISVVNTTSQIAEYFGITPDCN